MNIRSNHRGFSLIETALAVVIMAMIATFGLMSFSHKRATAQPKALAEEMLEEFRAARQEASTTQSPVALVFPGKAQSQAFYVVKGLVSPDVTKLKDFSEMYPEACFLWGKWGDAVDGVVYTDKTEETVRGADRTFLFSTWGDLASSDDSVICFTPSGSVVTNGLPTFGGNYRLLICAGARTAGSDFPSLQEVSEPFEITISPTGSVQLSKGLDGPNSVPVSASSLPISAPKPSVTVSQTTNQAPTLRQVIAEPAAPADDSVDVVVPEEGFAALVVWASDSDSESLTVEWDARLVGGTVPSGKTGNFSSDMATPMEWNPYEKRWEGRWMWTPPSGAENGAEFELNGLVTDDTGNVLKTDARLRIRVRAVQNDKVACVNSIGEEDGPQIHEVAWFNPEGNHVVKVTAPNPTKEMVTPTWSPTGKKLAFYANVEKTTGDKATAELWVVNDDGHDLTKLYEIEGRFNELALGPSWSPDGSFVSFSAYKVDGNLGNGSNGLVYKARSYRYGSEHTGEVVKPISQVDPNTDLPVVPLLYDDSDARYHPNDNWILFTRREPGEPTWACIKRAKKFSNSYVDPGPGDISGEGTFTDPIYPDGAIKVAQLTHSERGAESYWSPNGNEVVYVSGEAKRVCAKRVVIDSDSNPITVELKKRKIVLDFTDPTRPEHAFNHLFPSTPRVSPDGLKVAVVLYPDSDASQVRASNRIVIARRSTLAGEFKDFKILNNTSHVEFYCWDPLSKGIMYKNAKDNTVYRVGLQPSSKAYPISPEGYSAHTTPSWWARNEYMNN